MLDTEWQAPPERSSSEIKVAKEAEVIAAFRKFRKQKPDDQGSRCWPTGVAIDGEEPVVARGRPRRRISALEASRSLEMTPGFIAGAAVEGLVLWNRVLQGDHAPRDPDSMTVDEGLCGDAPRLQEEGEKLAALEWSGCSANPSCRGVLAQHPPSARERVLDWRADRLPAEDRGVDGLEEDPAARPSQRPPSSARQSRWKRGPKRNPRKVGHGPN